MVPRQSPVRGGGAKGHLLLLLLLPPSCNVFGEDDGEFDVQLIDALRVRKLDGIWWGVHDGKGDICKALLEGRKKKGKMRWWFLGKWNLTKRLLWSITAASQVKLP
jgi:hypothetical protein